MDDAEIIPIHRFPAGMFDERRRAYEQSRKAWGDEIGVPVLRWARGNSKDPRPTPSRTAA